MGMRELRDNLPAAIQRVRAGEGIEVTYYGHPVARIVPISFRGRYEQMVAEGKIIPPAGDRDLLDFTPLPADPAKPTLSEILAEMREGERYCRQPGTDANTMQQSDDHTAWVLVPFEAVGPLRMGMTRAEVAATLAEAPVPLPTPPGVGPSPVTREAFDGAGVHVEYDQDGALISVESVDRQVTYQGIPLRRRRAADVLADLGRIGVDASRDEQGVGLDAPALGLMFYVPGESDNERPGTILTVLAHCRDYADVTGHSE